MDTGPDRHVRRRLGHDLTPEEAADADRGTDTLPVDVDAVIARAGIPIGRVKHRDSQSSCCVDVPHLRMIGLNSLTSPRRQRFAAAHAYGHFRLGHLRPGRQIIVCNQITIGPGAEGASYPTGAEEAAATRYAGTLLLPAGPLRAMLAAEHDVGDHDSRDALIGRLAARCEVSRELMGWRLIWLGLTMA